MVPLPTILSSNKSLPTSLPANLVAVFVGGTGGIGLYTLQAFAKHAIKPRAYFIGRSQEAGDRITTELKTVNPSGEFIFIKADVGLIKNVDDVCKQISSREKSINILFLTQGTLVPGIKTEEGLHLAVALILHSRTRFIANFLPLLQNAQSLRRVVSVLAATKEGSVDTTDFQGWKIKNPIKNRGHGASMTTLSLEHLSKMAPEVSFIHNYPGFVKSGIARGTTGAIFGIMKIMSAVLQPFLSIPEDECGERQLFQATSARYPASEGGGKTDGVPIAKGVVVARGSDGEIGSGVYAIDENCESGSPEVEKLLARLRAEGISEKVWDHIEGEWKRITGTVAV